uniref:Uncharacterized protein n=1 Tax=Musca domestica TaxID=7370 RepID=A0A1I8NDW8_MUSDO
MYLKFETTLNVYQHEDNMVLCRVHLISPVSDKTGNGDQTFTTCRSLTADQWCCFEKELKSWLDMNREWSDIDVDKELHKFSVKPNVEVKIKRSKVSSKYFNRCLYKPPIDATDDVASKDSLPVLDCSLEYKTAKLAATSSMPTEEYNPYEYDPHAPSTKEQSISPPSYKPYTRTKRTRKNSSIDSIKPQDQYFLGFDSSEDTYSPNIERHLAASKISIPVYKPAPIDETRSPDPENEVILESDEEIMPTKTHRSIRVRDKHIHKTDSEYIPHSQETHEVVPAYKPTPIEKTDDDYGAKRIKEDLDAGEKTKSQTKKQSKKEKEVANEKQEKSSREEKSKTAYINEKKLTEDTNKLAAPSSDDDFDIESQSVTNKMNRENPSTKSETGGSSKKSSVSLSEDEFERIESKVKSSSSKNKKDKKDCENKSVPKSRIERKRSQSTDSKSKELTSGDKGTKSTINLPSIEEQSENNDTEERERKRKNKNKSPKTEKHSSKEYLTNESETCSLKQDRTSEDEFEASASKSKGKKKEKSSSLDAIKDDPMAEEVAAGVKEKKKDKRKEKLNSNDNNATQEEKENSEDISEQPIRRSGRSPSKPKRFIEEVGQYESKKKQKSSPRKKELFGTDDDYDTVGQHERKKKQKSSPKNKELFGTDDDHDTEVEDNSSKLLSSDNNNNANNKMHSVFETPKPDKKTKPIILQSSSSSSSAKKKRKRDDCEQEKAGMSKWLGKNQQSDDLINDESPKSSLKSTKKIKSSSKDEKKKRPKSPTPQLMEIVMPSEKELEMIRNKAKQQSADNEKFKAALEKATIVPKRVEQLCLKDMSLTDLMDTFSLYKTDLDQIFEKCRKKDYVKSHDGVNHCLVIGLIDHKIQLKMLEKLSEKYNSNNSTSQASMYANALLPEWILRIFMKRYDLNRSDAIQHIADQDAYKSYTDAENESSFLDDL